MKTEYAACAAAFAMMICGCSANTGTSQASSSAEETGGSAIVGGWTVSDITTSDVVGDDLERFEAATKELTGMNYEPYTVLAYQVVSGTNYAYLCHDQAVTANASAQWDIVTIYEDLSGNAVLLSTETIDLTDIRTTDKTAEAEVLGGWKIITAPMTEEDAGAEALIAAAEGTGREIFPVAVLGSQVVAGTNYKVLCMENTETDVILTIAEVWVNTEGKASLTSAETFDLTAYIGN